MVEIEVCRRDLILGTVAALASGMPRSVLALDSGGESQDLKIDFQPKRIFWAENLRHPDRTESCFFALTLGGLEPKLTGGTVSLLAAGKPVKSETWSEAYLTSTVQSLTDAKLRYMLVRVTEPIALAIDTIRMELRGEGTTGTVELKPERYVPKTKLVFPFRGPGLFTQTWVNEGGHSNGVGQFAVDALALTVNYAPQRDSRDANESYAGWGKMLLAPGAGVVVAVQNDIPDQARPGSEDPSTYRLPGGRVVSHGNHVTIDHENGEFSTVAHLQRGSVEVKVGERVRSGAPIGRLGNSGSSFGPHVHYQLHDGRDADRSNGLPCRFENVGVPIRRGSYFEAK